MTVLDLIGAAFTIAGVLATVFAVALALALALNERRMQRERGARRLAREPEAVIADYERRARLYAVPRDELAERRDARGGGRCA